ncbi:SSU ribosomal protein S4p (S9e) [Dehalococcoides mccartyi]|uniref:SSU ribosomal protein S4p (S9e) n=1 Tax=Dehalococcoides mccartyi TaxID=61435 RepID=A0A328EQ52_9CHLR|nr:SSU ribosomal protein S4p (S9e) [Dehalococcoides mccartyi]
MCRRSGDKLFLKGDKCVTKCVFEKRPKPPASAGQTPPSV